MPNHVTNKLLFHPCTEQNTALLILEGLSPSRKDSSWVILALRK